jgi:drug/metabolite transporter (DMT)-like permease
MSNNSVYKGVFLVGLGAACYGMLATFVRLAYDEGYTTAEVTGSQILLGILGVGIIYFFQKNGKKNIAKASPKNKIQLMVAGTSIGFTSVFYYLSVKFIPVSIAIVLLMQSVWMGVLVEWLITKKAPSVKKFVAVAIILAGTLLATNLIDTKVAPNWPGIFWGLLAAASYTVTMYAGNSIATGLISSQRTLYMLFGGAAVVLAFTIITWQGGFNFDIFLIWGIPLALFGTILPPLFMNAGFPSVSMGLGSIVSALELPVSVTMAYFILHEHVNTLQWVGITLILTAIVLMNISRKAKL